MNTTFEVVREAPDKLSNETWVFTLLTDSFLLVLNSYRRGSRPSARHRYRAEFGYDRLNGRDSTIREADVPWPADVHEEARTRCLAAIAENLRVGRWHVDLGL